MLRQQGSHQAAQYVAAAGSGQAGVAAVVFIHNPPVWCAHQGFRTFEHHIAAVALGNIGGRQIAVTLHLFHCNTQQACRFQRMRREHHIIGQKHCFYRQQVQRIGIQQQRCISMDGRCRGLLQQLTRGIAHAQAAANSVNADVAPLHQLCGGGDHDFRIIRQIRYRQAVLRKTEPYFARPAFQGRTGRQHTGAGHAGRAAHHSHRAERAFMAVFGAWFD